MTTNRDIEIAIIIVKFAPNQYAGQYFNRDIDNDDLFFGSMKTDKFWPTLEAARAEIDAGATFLPAGELDIVDYQNRPFKIIDIVEIVS